MRRASVCLWTQQTPPIRITRHLISDSQHYPLKKLLSPHGQASPLVSLRTISLNNFNATMRRNSDLFSFKNYLNGAKKLITSLRQERCYSHKLTSDDITPLTSEPIVGHKLKVTFDIFGALVKGDCVIVDKTMMIKEFLEGEDLCLITRPRRFGKSLNISMLQHFFAPTVDGLSTKGLFDQFGIAQVDNGEFLRKHQGQYPVISVTFKDVKEKSYTETIDKFNTLIKKLYRQHEHLLAEKSKFLNQSDRALFKKYLEGEVNIGELEEGLQFLSEFLYKVNNHKRVIVLIDEYDAPLSSAYDYGFLNELGIFMRNMFSATLKGNSYVHKGLMTGVLRVSQSTMLSGLNNLVTYSVLEKPYQQYFGFTEAEVKALALRAGFDQPVDEDDIKKHYNGYKIADTILYNPWSMMQYASSKELQPYWVLTASDTLLKKVLLNSRAEDKAKLQELIQGNAVSCEVNANLRYEDLMSDPNALWTLLLSTGYLTVKNRAEGFNHTNYGLTIPNLEILKQYTKIFADWLKEKAGGSIQYDLFLKSLVNGDINTFKRIMNEYMENTLSVRDVGGDKPQPERFYHGLVIGLVASLHTTHLISSNKEGGLGFYDMVIVPKQNTGYSLAIIAEFKRAKDNAALQEEADTALVQIDSKRYQTALNQYPHIDTILKIGMAFNNKNMEMCARREELRIN